MTENKKRRKLEKVNTLDGERQYNVRHQLTLNSYRHGLYPASKSYRT
jgi:hypothetical protein